jgi:hypothetical protein
VKQPKLGPAGGQRECREPRHHCQRAAQQARGRHQQRGGRRLLRSAQVQREREASEGKDEDEIAPAGVEQRVRIGALDPYRPLNNTI